MSLFTEKKLQILFKEETDINGDAAEWSGKKFITMSMILMLDMISSDLNLPIEYLNKGSDEADIYVNFDDEDEKAVFDRKSVERIWPHYQNRYCLIYANTVRVPAQVLLRSFNVLNVAIVISWFIGWAIFYLINHRKNLELILVRSKRNWFDLLMRSYSSSIQSQVMSSTPEIDLNSCEKFLIGGKLMHNLLIGSMYMSFFATQFILPKIRFANDAEAARIYERQIDPIMEFGIGERCLFELEQGLYKRRCCFVACDVANKTVQNHKGIVFLNEEVNFQNFLKVSTKSPFFKDIKRIIRIYMEAGVLDHIFKSIHQNSHKFLEEMQYDGHISFSELWLPLIETLCDGFIAATVAFFGEWAYYRWQK